ncbi:Ger(x)C family spore germination protein [Mesobacillus sp. AQ2]|jgi:spore germination protein KC|uniref:Ger(x)C family spore germination protein n=1 Tax=unclassified Mesobacillus TaxID=2675270 RepID=UPI00203FAF19|nr:MULTISPECIES: Ger(x)C family spore germination protein [unclassified Mesobacillus]MCM3125920.1 Ger(x)C family spore germination protein [Mesobacillus sp. MER 33]MCM3235093.1 Ger(x)C family spore germination protein [Mesobacillus sp. MER 48]WHX39974.1 Ger(x)C family spore germination protein [Mesobacillus sp. AQ2]
MKIHSIIIKVAILSAITLSLAGCWDHKELDDKAYVIGIGLDKHKAEGKVRVTYLIANPEVGSQQTAGGANEPPQEIVTLVADDFISSRNTANTVVAKEISYDLLQVLIVSEELARDPDFIRVIYSATKDREIKRSAQLLVTREDAADFIKFNQPRIETRPHKFLELMIERGQETGMIPEADLNSFFRVTESDADLFLAIYATTKKVEKDEMETTDDDLMAGEIQVKGTTNNAQFMGSAVFKEGMMIGKITGEETRISSLLDNTWTTEDILTAVQDPFDERYKLSLRISQKKSNKFKLITGNGRPTIEIEVPLFIEVYSDPSMTNYAKNRDKVKKLKKSLTAAIGKNFTDFIVYSQEELKGDTFDLSIPMRKEFATLREFREFDWMHTYPDAAVKVNVSIRFGEFGRQTKLPDLEEVRD